MNKRLIKIFLVGCTLVLSQMAISNDIDALLSKAKQGDVESQFKLGTKYYKGEELSKNKNTARYWFEKAANKGHAEAQSNLGMMYYSGDGGLPKSPIKGTYWLEKSAAQEDKAALYFLGFLHLIKKEYKQAIPLFERAAKQGHTTAQTLTGFGYAKGMGVKKDYDKGIHWFEQAARSGDKKAKEALIAVKKAKAEDEAWNTGIKIVAGAALAAVATKVITSNHDSCLRPDNNCSSSQLRRHKSLISKAMNSAKYLCGSPTSIKDLFNDIAKKAVFYSAMTLEVYLVGESNSILVDIDQFKERVNC